MESIELGPKNKVHVKEACGIVAYQQQTDTPVIKLLMSDDAGQFKKITEEQILCWIHDGRHYKKMRPLVKYHREILDNFLTKYWDYYHKLLDYKDQPSPEKSILLDKEFDTLFKTTTDYQNLNDRIKKIGNRSDPSRHSRIFVSKANKNVWNLLKTQRFQTFPLSLHSRRNSGMTGCERLQKQSYCKY